MDQTLVTRHIRQAQQATVYSRVPSLLRTQQRAVTICGAAATTNDLSWADARGVAAREWITCADCRSAIGVGNA